MHKTAVALLSSATSKKLGNSKIIHGTDHNGHNIRLYIFHKTCLAYINDSEGSFYILRGGWYTVSTSRIINQLIKTLSMRHVQLTQVDDIGNTQMLKNVYKYNDYKKVTNKLRIVAEGYVSFDGIEICNCGSTDIETALDEIKICNTCRRIVAC